MTIERRLYDAAIEIIVRRYPHGWGGAAALYTAGGQILTSVAPEVDNASTELCIETGAICEVHKLADAVTHSLCVVRDDDDQPFKILSPCGVCQKRLWFRGDAIMAAVSSDDRQLVFKRLKGLQPYYWSRAYTPHD